MRSQLKTPASKEETAIQSRVAISRAIAVALLLPAANASAQAQSSDGKVAFNTSCRTCHSMNEGDHRLGPSLHNVAGSEAGSAEGYNYSRAMSESNVVWDAEALDRFIENPEAVISGNNMKPYGGISDPEVRSRIVSYLEEESSQASDGN